MKSIFFLTLSLFYSIFGYSQNDSDKATESNLGKRMMRTGRVYEIFKDDNNKINYRDSRKLNYRHYFVLVDGRELVEEGKKYVLISIPGIPKPLSKEDSIISTNKEFIRSGRSINDRDYDSNFWIDENIVAKYSEPSFFRYSSDFFSGVLTAPFKYRIKIGETQEALIDGDFNVAPFLGWKFRLSSRRDYFITPFFFSGITTLNFNSSVSVRPTPSRIRRIFI